jgi:vacuolar-type H+-ATPase subunit E/Vma4
VEGSSDPGRLFAALEGRAREERDRIEAEAAERASGILADAARDVERIRTQARLDLRRQLVIEGKRLAGEARLRVRMERLHAKRALLAEVFAGASAEIERLRAGRGYRAALDALAAQARASIGEPCSVEVSEENGSVVATSTDGKRRADNGIAARIRAAGIVAEPEVAKLLFGARQSQAPSAGGGSA